MPETRISSTELARTIGEILGRIRFRGESFVVERNGHPVAILAPYASAAPRGLKAVLRAWSDAAEPDEALPDLLENLRRDDAPLEDPWA